MMLQKRNKEGKVVSTECLEIPETMTRQAAEDLIRQGLIPPDSIAPLDPPSLSARR